jgi:uncharacterized membrane protein
VNADASGNESEQTAGEPGTDGGMVRQAGVPWADICLGGLAVGIMLALLAAAPRDLLDKADRAAYAVCHRLVEHSFIVAGRQLPLCARCTGTYLGVLAGMVALAVRGRGRAGDLPAKRHLVVLALFLGAWAVDGVNSYLALFPAAPHLYEPANWLRLVTGTLEGLAISAILVPLVARSVWAGPGSGRSVRGWGDMAGLLAAGGLVVAAAAGGWAPLLYPLALLSGALVAGLLGMLNGVLVLALLRRPAGARGIRLAAPFLAGGALAMLELGTIGLARSALAAGLGMPF